MSDGDEILRYYSVVGNSDVPYPVAIGRQSVYFMLETPVTAEPFAKYATLTEDEQSDAYTYYYGHKCASCPERPEGCGCVKYERVNVQTRTIMKRDF